MKENYRLKMEEMIRRLPPDEKPRLLLHVCCAPCASAVLTEICENFEVTCYYYNPNISPREEYEKRGEELARLIQTLPCAKDARMMEGPYDAALFERMAEGREAEEEGGGRCFSCYQMRLESTARAAKAGGFDYFCTSLSISPYKNAAKLNELGGELGQRYGVMYLYSDFKKKGGYLRSIELSKIYSLYRQDYCGCRFSKAQAEHRRLRADEIQKQD